MLKITSSDYNHGVILPGYTDIKFDLSYFDRFTSNDKKKSWQTKQLNSSDCELEGDLDEPITNLKVVNNQNVEASKCLFEKEQQ